MILKKLKPSKHLPVWPGLLSALILELKQIPIVKKNPPFSFLVYVNSADYKKIQGVRSKARKKKITENIFTEKSRNINGLKKIKCPPLYLENKARINSYGSKEKQKKDGLLVCEREIEESWPCIFSGGTRWRVKVGRRRP